MNCQLSFYTAETHPAVVLACQELTGKFTELCGELQQADSSIVLEVQTPVNNEVDEYCIDVDLAASCGFIRGSNPRSVLFGAYRLLREIGFSWVRPGAAGEIVPKRPAVLPHIKVSDRAFYRYRGICIEGAVSRENVLDFIHWQVKYGINSYFIQFQDAYTFFARWYCHEENPLLPPEPFDRQRAAALTAEVRQEVIRLGLDLHMVGHGWTCEPLGIHGEGWYQSTQEIAPEIRQYLAQVNGKRELWGGIALNTNLCYGNPQVRQIMIKSIVDYARKNQDVNILHFWLGDAANNHCECELCTALKPADWYIELLNGVDNELAAAGLNTKIVFLIYCDLLWPPEQKKLQESDRFILMFAPISRSYSRSFSPGNAEQNAPELPEYVRNQIKLPDSPELNLAFLRKWQAGFSGSGFSFDYHFMWDHYKDPGNMQITRVFYDDCRQLTELGLHGLVSCQTQRAFFPHGLGMAILGTTLWDKQKSFENIRQEYFQAAYGDDHPAALEYFETVSELFTPAMLRGETDEKTNLEIIGKFPEYAQIAGKVQPFIQRNLNNPSAARRESWRQLVLHVEMCNLWIDFLTATVNNAAPEKAMESLLSWAQSHENELQSSLDIFELVTTVRDRILPRIKRCN